MSPQRYMQADLARSSDLNLTLYIENFIKEKVSEIVLLWIIESGVPGPGPARAVRSRVTVCYRTPGNIIMISHASGMIR